MPRLLQIAQLGNPILRQRASDVDLVDNPEIQELIDDMLATCLDSGGMGIAAPQVYRPCRVIIVASAPNARYPKAPKYGPEAMVNPTIGRISTVNEVAWEGCLSVPGLRGQVSRPKKIEISFLSRHGVRITEEAEGFVARIIQHEIDHLNGIMFSDHVDSKNLVTEKEWLRLTQKI